MRIEPPPFDPLPHADHEYLATVMAVSEPRVLEALHALGFHATPTKGTSEFDPMVPGLFHNLLDTQDHGRYEARFLTQDGGKAPPTVRLWWQMENADGSFAPVALDVANTGGLHLTDTPNGVFTHTGTHDHDNDTGIATLPMPGAGGNIAGLVYKDIAQRVVTIGPRPDVKLEKTYMHV
jgi:hypothetical protein